MYLFCFDYDTNCFQITNILYKYTVIYRHIPGIFMKVSSSSSNAVILWYSLFSSAFSIATSPNNYKMSTPSKVLENYRHLCASKLLSTYQTSPSKSHLNMQTRHISCGWGGVKIKCMQRGKEIGALTCMLAGLSSCDEIWFGESFDITRQWYPKDTGEMASPLIAMFHYNMHITWLPRARF